MLTKNNSKEKWKPKPVGLGVDVAGVLGWTDENETYRTYSPMVIFLSLTPDPNFRIETEIGALFFQVVMLTIIFRSVCLVCGKKKKQIFTQGLNL